MQHDPETQFLARDPLAPGGEAERLAYKATAGKAPTILWCGGLMSDMEGTKAVALHRWAARKGHAFVRFDYHGHGASTGAFTDGTITRWAEDTLAVIDDLTEGPLILIGSSMGGWVGLLAARARDRVRALLLINPAPDFTEDVFRAFTPEQQHAVRRDGIVHIPTDYGDPYPYSWALIEDGRANLLLQGDLGLDIPVHIFSGDLDTVVPTAHCQRLANALANATLTVVEGGDHSLSRPEDIKALEDALASLAKDA